MKSVVIIATLALLACSSAFARSHSSSSASSYRAPKSSTTHVDSYTTKRGSYVASHYRTAADHTKINNWSSKPNMNPYTGQAGTKDPYGH